MIAFDHGAVYAARNKNKIRAHFFTYEAMWAAAGELSKRLYPNIPGRHGASTVVHVALAKFLTDHGVTAPEKIKEIKRLDVCGSTYV